MARRSELEDFLHQLHADGRLESRGDFTLAREKALDKLAAFLLPRPTAWASKLVQAAVVSGASALTIKGTGLGTEFHFDPQVELTLQALEASFFSPEMNVHPALDHLRQALWSVSLNGMRPFHFSPPGSPEALVWTGSAFRRGPCREAASFVLTVSHRTVWEGQGLPLLRSLEAARINSETALELAERAFVCPIPVTLDGRRLDRLQASPTHGFCPTSFPIALVFARADVPPLPVPPGTFVAFSTPAGPLNRLLKPAPKVDVTAAACLIALHAERATQRGAYKALPKPSLFHWVRHGVVVSTAPINLLNSSSVSCAVFASADGLRTDLAGLSVAEGNDTRERQHKIYAGLWSQIALVDLTLSPDNLVGKRVIGVVGSGLLYLGGALAWGGALPALLAVAAGIVGVAYAAEPGADEELVQAWRAALKGLKLSWPGLKRS